MGDARGGRRAIVFDGECGICTWLAERALRMDRRGRFEIMPYQDLSPETLGRFAITREDCSRRLYALDPWPPETAGAGEARPAHAAPTAGRAAGARPSSVAPTVERAAGRKHSARGGALAVNVFLWRCFPWSIFVVLVNLVPVLLLAEVLLYALVAKHRAWISRRLGLRGCRLHG